MISEAPPFWWARPDWRAWALSPVSSIYAAVARRRLVHAERRRVDAPVLCVGNLTVGGSGKTPVAAAIAGVARSMNLKPGILSRGYGGSSTTPHLVDAHHDLARHVGDEPLLLARAAPVAVTADRAAGAELLIGEGCDFLIMDDGLQSARVHIDYALVVVDARRGIGNGYTVPAGPMRGRLVDQMRHCDGLLRMGEGDGADLVIRQAAKAGRAFFQASLVATRPEALSGRRCLAFAGIGDPGKFFRTLDELGVEVEQTRTFADHHAYTGFDAQDLIASADAHGLALVTTAKDAVRLDHADGALKALRERVHVVEVEARFEVDHAPRAIIEETMAAFRRRRLES